MSQLEVSKQFACSKEQLFNAWTQADQLKTWWKPLGKQLKHVENDLKEGGVVAYHFDDDNLTIEGNYDKVENHNLLEYSWNWRFALDEVKDADYKLSVRFSEEGDSSSILVTQTGFKSGEGVDTHKHGWEEGLEQLKAYLEQSSTEQPETGSLNEEAPVTGYLEDPDQVKVGGA